MLTKAVAVFGPLPYGMDECWDKSKIVNQRIGEKLQQRRLSSSKIKKLKRSDIETSCIRSKRKTKNKQPKENRKEMDKKDGNLKVPAVVLGSVVPDLLFLLFMWLTRHRNPITLNS